MRFGVNVEAAGELPPPGEYVALVVGAVEKPAPWDRERDCWGIKLEVVAAGRIFTFEDSTGLEAEFRLADICRAFGVPPVGDVNPEVFVGRRVGIEVRHKLTKSGRDIATVGRWFEPPAPKVETRPAARPVVRNSEPPADDGDDIPF